MILLTGAAGFIGSNVLAALNKAGVTSITCVDDVTDPRKLQNLANREFVNYADYHSFCTPDTLQELRGTYETVIHLGATVDTTATNGRDVVQNNYTCTVNLLEKLRPRNFIYASSAAVYGGAALPAGGFREIAEHERPRSPYAISKWMVDQYMRGKMGTTDRPARIIGLRFFNVYGPGESHKDRMASFVFHALKAVKHDKPIEIFKGTFGVSRDFVYIDDVVQVIEWARTQRPHTGIYNVGSGISETIDDVLDAASVALPGNMGIDPQEIPFPPEISRHYQRQTAANLDKLRAASYHEPFTRLEEGISRYWAAEFGGET